MKDFVTKATFGFVMAQLFPGAVAAFAIAFSYFTIETVQPKGLLATADDVLRRWGAASVPQKLFLAALCIALGMVIHGLHWASLGALEHRNRGSVYRTPWHRRALWLQVLGGPYRVLADLCVLFWCTKDIRHASMDENVVRVKSELMPQFEFLEEFYLSSGQFFMHTAYALWTLLVAVAVYVIAYGITWKRLVVAGVIYLLVGLFFTLGRVTLRSLFAAEEGLAKQS